LPSRVCTCHREESDGRALEEYECQFAHEATPFCASLMETLAQQLHLQVVPSFLARTSPKLVSQEKNSKQYSKNCQGNNQCDSDNIVLRHKGKPIHHQFSQIFTASKRRCAMTAGPNRACNAPGRGRRTNSGGNALGPRGLANSHPTMPSTRHRE
jgi:hypothetical protein